MLRIGLAAADLVSIRASYSPYWDILAAAMVSPTTVTHMRSGRRPNVVTAAAELGALPSLAFLRRGKLATFLVHLPNRPGEPLEATLERLARVPLDTIEKGLDACVAADDQRSALHSAWREPACQLAHIADAIWRVWKSSLEPIWSSVAAIHEGHLVRTGLLLATGGPTALLDDLRPAAVRRADALAYADHETAEVTLNGSGVVFISSLFAPAGHIVSVEPGQPGIIIHPPAGRALLWTERRRTDRDPAGELIGEPRADILRLLGVPRATADVGRLLSMAPNTTSYHLSRLKEAGLVRSVRVGRRVYYGLTTRGSAFLALWPAPSTGGAVPARAVSSQPA